MVCTSDELNAKPTHERVTFETRYDMNEDRKISVIVWTNGHLICSAHSLEDGNAYQYYSRDPDTDVEDVAAPKLMSLADCILAANVFLGLIPPQDFNSIPCENEH